MLENPAGLVYGILIVGALLDAESAANENYPDTVGAVVTALVLVWLAHSYADFVGERFERGHRLRLAELSHSLVHGLAVLLGAVAPLLALVLCWAAGASLTTAVNVGVIVSAGMLVVIEVTAGLRAHLSGAALLLQTVVGVVLGALIIGLKLVLH